MGTEIPLSHASRPFVEDSVCNRAHGAVLVDMQNCDLSIKIAGDKKKTVVGCGRQMAAPHSADGGCVQAPQISIGQDPKRSHSLIRGCIQVSPIRRRYQVSCIADFDFPTFL